MIPTAKHEEALLSPLLDRLSAYQPSGVPVISLYLNLQPDPQGRDHHDQFVRKEVAARARTYPRHSPERESLEHDVERIKGYLNGRVRRSANGAAIFSCSADEVFEAADFDAPIDENQLYIHPYPHLYPLARVMDQYPRYGVLLTDTNTAHLFVVGLGGTLYREQLASPRMRRTAVGGWAQARYQRHVDNLYLHHAKEVAEALDRLIRREALEKVVVAGEEIIMPLLREQLPRHLADRLIEARGIDMATPETAMLRATIEVMHQADALDDAARVEHLIHEYRADGLAVIGARETLAALGKGQVDELLISANARDIRSDDLSDQALDEGAATRVANDLVLRARQTAAAVTFIEDGKLLADVGGVGARLRYKAT